MSPLLFFSVTLFLLVTSQFWNSQPDFAHAATVRSERHRATSGAQIPTRLIAHAAQLPGGMQRWAPQGSRGGARDPLRHHRAIVGRDARTPWYARVRSIMGLVLVVGGLGAALAGFTLVVIASGRILLEMLAG